MIARHETHLDKIDIWSALAAPLPPGVISWRQDGRPISRDGRHLARFVAYIEANTVRDAPGISAATSSALASFHRRR